MAIDLKQHSPKSLLENGNSSKTLSGRYSSIKANSENRLKRFGWVKRIIQSNKSNTNSNLSQSRTTRRHADKNSIKLMVSSQAVKPLCKSNESDEAHQEEPEMLGERNQRIANNTIIMIDECTTGGSLPTVTHETVDTTESVNDAECVSNNSLYVDDIEGFQQNSFLSNDNTSLEDIVDEDLTCNVTSVFDGSVMHLGTPQTSVASGLLVPITTASLAGSNYAYSNPIQGSINLTGSGVGYSRSIANSLLNNNDSSSIITLASSTRNILNRSKSGCRSIETYNSSTIGIPPSSVMERLNRGLSSGNIPCTEDDDKYSLNNSLRTHSHINSRFGDAHSFRSYRTGRLSVND